MKGLLLEILEHLDTAGPSTPGDTVAAVGAPRYRVLAAFHCLEEMGLVVPLYSKGTYKIYQISELGRILLRAAASTGGLSLAIQEMLGSRITSKALEGEVED